MKLSERLKSLCEVSGKIKLGHGDRFVATNDPKSKDKFALIAVDDGDTLSIHKDEMDGEKILDLPKDKSTYGELKKELKKLKIYIK